MARLEVMRRCVTGHILHRNITAWWRQPSRVGLTGRDLTRAMASRRMPAPHQPTSWRVMTPLGLKRRFVPQALRLGLGGLLCAFAVSTLMADSQPPRADWPMFGQNLQNTATTS